MKVIRYESRLKQDWDAFVRKSKNATFLLYRDYMDYHSDRFEDCSLLICDDSGKIVSMFPASRHGDEVRSHGGLTYGGFIMSEMTTGADPMMWLDLVEGYYKKEGVRSMLYKPIPHIYHAMPSEEDLYALFRHGAELEWRTLSSAIDLRHEFHSSRLKKRALKREQMFGITIRQVPNANLFWDIIVEDRRVRHNVTPVHTCAEMQLLRDRFPENILFYVAESVQDGLLAGAVIYKSRDVLHLQYAAANAIGKNKYAVDVIYYHLIYDLFCDAAWFDFGISNENSGSYLNEGMVHHKEEFGARSIMYDAYRVRFDD